MNRIRRPRPRRVLAPALAAVVVLVAVAGCAAAPAPPGAAETPTEAEDRATITADRATSPLPAGLPGRGAPKLRIGTKDFPEQFLLGELYAQALRHEGFDVDVDSTLGGTETIDSAFRAGRIQMYPEYLGEITSVLTDVRTEDAAQTYEQARSFERQPSHDADVLPQAPYENVDVIVVRADDAARYGLRSVSDLAKLRSGGEEVRIAAQQPFRTRRDGLSMLQRVSGVPDMQMLAVTTDETYGALDAGQVQVADGFSTDAELLSGKYVALDAGKDFGFQYMAPVVRNATLQQGYGEAFRQTCNWVTSLLTTDAVQNMNRQVQRDGLDEGTVAATFLGNQPEWKAQG